MKYKLVSVNQCIDEAETLQSLQNLKDGQHLMVMIQRPSVNEILILNGKAPSRFDHWEFPFILDIRGKTVSIVNHRIKQLPPNQLSQLKTLIGTLCQGSGLSLI